MIKTILAQVREYRLSTVLAPLFTVGEVVLEVLIPFVTASIIDKGIQAGNIQQVYLYGGLMLIMALLSLVCGVLAGRFAAKASSGLACNLRESIYEKVQTFAFSNIDKFSTAGLVTRMTTDVTNVQNAAQMLLRVAVRAPLMLVCSMVSPSVQGITRLRLRPAPCRSSRSKAKAPVRTAGEGAFSQDSASFTYLDGVSGKRQMSLCLLRRFPVHLFFRLRRERFPPHADQPAGPAGAKNDWFLEREVPLSGNQPFFCFLKFCHTRCVGEKAPASSVKNLRVSRPPAPVARRLRSKGYGHVAVIAGDIQGPFAS